MTETTPSSTTTTTTTATATKIIEAAIRQQLLQQINTTTTTTTDELGGGAAEELEQRKAADDMDADYRVQMYQLVVPAFLLLSLLAVVANSLVIVALRASRVRNAMVTLLLSLTFSDIWSSSVMAVSLLLNSYLPTVFHTRPRPCFALCLEMFRTGGLLTAAFHLLLIALLHCVGIVRPHLDKALLRRWAFLLCLLAWSLPPALLFLLASIRPAQGLWQCERVDFYFSKGFRWAVSGLLFSLFLAITLCYGRLLYILHSQTAKLASSSTSTGDKGNGAVLPGERKRRRERRTMGTTLLICISFLLGWAPASILFAITCSDCRFLTGSFRLLFGLSCVQLSFLLAKSLLNPLIYSLRIPEVRQQFGRMLNRCLPRLLGWTGIAAIGKCGGGHGGGGLLGATSSTPFSVAGGRKPSGGGLKPCRSNLFASSVSSVVREDLVAAAASATARAQQQQQDQQQRKSSLFLLVPDRVCVANNHSNNSNSSSNNNHFLDDDNQQQQQVEQQDHGEDKALSPPPPPPRQQLPVSQRRSLNLEGNTTAAPSASAAAYAAGCWRKRPAKKDGEQEQPLLIKSAMNFRRRWRNGDDSRKTENGRSISSSSSNACPILRYSLED